MCDSDSGLSTASSTDSLEGAAAVKSETPPSYSESFIGGELNNFSNECYIEDNALHINPQHARMGKDSGLIIGLDTPLVGGNTVRKVVEENAPELLIDRGAAVVSPEDASAAIARAMGHDDSAAVADYFDVAPDDYMELGPEDPYLIVLRTISREIGTGPEGTRPDDTYIECMAAAVVSQPTAHKSEGHKSVLNINQSREASDAIFEQKGEKVGDFLFRVTSSASDITLSFGPDGGIKNVGKFCLKCDVEVGAGSEGRLHYALSPTLYDGNEAAKTSLKELMGAFNSNAPNLNTKLLEHINKYEKPLPPDLDLNTCLNSARPAIGLGRQERDAEV